MEEMERIENGENLNSSKSTLYWGSIDMFLENGEEF
jgi:hypothetical protein